MAKFLSIDPLTKDYPELTPYQFASNTPISAIDLDGLEGFEINYWHSYDRAAQKIIFHKDITINQNLPFGQINITENRGNDAEKFEFGGVKRTLTFPKPNPSQRGYFIVPFYMGTVFTTEPGVVTLESIINTTNDLVSKGIADAKLDEKKGTKTTEQKTFKSNETMEGEIFTAKGTFVVETQTIDYQVETTINIYAVDINSVAVKTLKELYEKNGYKDVKLVQQKEINNPKVLKIEDSKNPNGVFVEVLSTAKYTRKVQVIDVNVKEITHKKSGKKVESKD